MVHSIPPVVLRFIQVFTKCAIPRITYDLGGKYNYQEKRLAIEKEKGGFVTMIKIDICVKNVRIVMLRSYIYIYGRNFTF